jgi:hypothetical protein
VVNQNIATVQVLVLLFPNTARSALLAGNNSAHPCEKFFVAIVQSIASTCV